MRIYQLAPIVLPKKTHTRDKFLVWIEVRLTTTLVYLFVYSGLFVCLFVYLSH